MILWVRAGGKGSLVRLGYRFKEERWVINREFYEFIVRLL